MIKELGKGQGERGVRKALLACNEPDIKINPVMK